MLWRVVVMLFGLACRRAHSETSDWDNDDLTTKAVAQRLAEKTRLASFLKGYSDLMPSCPAVGLRCIHRRWANNCCYIADQALKGLARL